MPTVPSRVWARRLQRAIERVRGVTAARIVLDDAHQVAEIHLVGAASRPAKQIVRDVESLLFAEFGIRTDYRRISVAQLDAEPVSVVRSRLKLVEAAPDPQAVDTLQVLLQTNERLYRGTAPIPTNNGAHVPAGAVAQATVGAVQQAIGDVAVLSLGGAESVATSDQIVYLVVVNAATSHGNECLTGSCVVRGNALAAVAKATLDAINRRLPVWYARAQANMSEPVYAEALPSAG
jgi:hypothetical protein